MDNLQEKTLPAVRHTAGRAVHQLFEREVEKAPSRIALVYGDQTITYAELNTRANSIAHHLLSVGIEPEARVALMMDRSPEFIICILGILKAGGAYLPLDPEYPVDRLAMMIESARPALLLTRASMTSELATAGEGATWIDVDSLELATLDKGNPGLPGDGGNLAYVMFTSGSTGQPKGVMIEHGSIEHLVKDTDYIDFGPDDVVLQIGPVTFDASTWEIWGALLNGSRLVIMPSGVQSLSDVGTVIRERGVTTTLLTTGLFHLMVDERIDDLRPLRRLVVGGDVLSASHAWKFLSHVDCDVINAYGPTENTVIACCYRVPRDSQLESVIPIGRPIARTRVYILDPEMVPVPEGESGELYIAGDGLARGYVNRDDLTSERFLFSPHPELSSTRLYRTGDQARRRPDGNIQFLGRVDNQVKINGFRIELAEVEAALSQYAGVRQAVTIAREISTANKQLLAFIVPNSDEVVEVPALRRHLEASLPKFMIPSFIFSVRELPLTKNGKVDRSALLETIGAGQVRSGTFTSPESSVERVIASLLEEILQAGPVGTDDNFFDLGANSLQLTSMHNRLQELFDSRLRITSLFQNPTVRTLARCFEAPAAPVSTLSSHERGLRQRAAYFRKRHGHLEEVNS